LARELGLAMGEVPDLPPRWNLAPTQPVAILKTSSPSVGARPAIAMHAWGLVPPWANDPRTSSRRINARRESIATKPSFRDSFLDRRCLVLADGFYEWSPVGLTGARVPHYIRLRSGRAFTMAGLWATWRSPAGEPLHTCTIVTGPPNSMVARLHDRMPVILDEAARAPWMSPTTRDEATLLALLRTFPADEMEAYPVSRHVNSPANDDATCIAPWDPPVGEGPPDLFRA
jgi:putative SOS response-associated peptidase YedK